MKIFISILMITTLLSPVLCSDAPRDLGHVLGRGDEGPPCSLDYLMSDDERGDREMRKFEDEVRRLDEMFKMGIDMIAGKLDIMVELLRGFQPVVAPRAEPEREVVLEPVDQQEEEEKPEVRVGDYNARTKKVVYSSGKKEEEGLKPTAPPSPPVAPPLPTIQKRPPKRPVPPAPPVCPAEKPVKRPAPKPPSPEPEPEPEEEEEIVILIEVPETIEVQKDGKVADLKYDGFVREAIKNYVEDLIEEVEKEVALITDVILPGLHAVDERIHSKADKEHLDSMIQENYADMKEKCQNLQSLKDLDIDAVKQRCDNKVLHHLNTSSEPLDFSDLAAIVNKAVDDEHQGVEDEDEKTLGEQIEEIVEEIEESVEDDIRDFLREIGSRLKGKKATAGKRALVFGGAKKDEKSKRPAARPQPAPKPVPRREAPSKPSRHPLSRALSKLAEQSKKDEKAEESDDEPQPLIPGGRKFHLAFR